MQDNFLEVEVVSFEDLPEEQAYYDFHVPVYENYAACGVWNHNTGKSLSAKAISSTWGVPLLRLDMGAAKSKWVGESEANIRAALRLTETVGRSVLWIDEIEKALGASMQGAADGGVSQDALGTLLSWMQERKGGAFVVATANDVRQLPPELLRKGRFDEIFCVDLPTAKEREEVLSVALREVKRNPETIDLPKVSAVCREFTGAEMTAVVKDALYRAFEDGERPLTTADLLAEASLTTPLARTAKEKLDILREWAKGRARPATVVEVETETEVEAPRAINFARDPNAN